MKKLKELQQRYLNTDLKAEEAIKEIFDIYLNTDDVLSLYGLTIKYHDYGLYQLRENGEYLMEGEETECLERASEIITKINNK